MFIALKGNIALKVFPFSEFISRGSPRRATKQQKFRINAYAVKSGTVSRCTALDNAQV